MPKVCQLFSGSSGNAIWIAAGNTKVLVDAGVSAKRIETALNQIGENAAELSAVFVTHEHGDHVSGLRVLASRYGIPVFTHEKVMAVLDEKGILSDKFSCERAEAHMELCGMEVSVIALIGFIMLMGVIVNNGIVLVDYINQLRLSGISRREAILEAGVTRMRPILMTTLTTVLGQLVMAVSKDAGSLMMRPIAVVSIGGLLYATLMTLFVVPCIYDMMNKKELRKIEDKDLEILDI